MQPTYEPRSARSAGVRWSSATTSAMPMRPPGVSTRCISASTAGLSTDRLITQLEVTTSTVSAGGGADALGREQHVDAAARAEVQDGLAAAQLGDGGGVAAAEAGQQRGLGEGLLLVGGVLVDAEPLLVGGGVGGAAAGAVAAAVGGLAAAAVVGDLAGAGLLGGGGVAGTDLLA